VSTGSVEFVVHPDTDAVAVSEVGCAGKRISCSYFARPLIELQKHELFGGPLHSWRYCDTCRCMMPPQTRLDKIQFLHIPKTGTSINWFFHDYFDCAISNSSQPCSQWLESEVEQRQGLCNGRLFSCMGHAVHPSLPELVIKTETYLVILLRHPWERMQSDYHHTVAHPFTGHLGPNLDVSKVLESVSGPLEYALYPGISNCATKMLNGYHCGDKVKLSEHHLDVAKSVLDNALFVGISEYFKTSICLFSWIYGGTPKEYHFNKFREGNYTHIGIDELTESDIKSFRDSERYDLSLYAYALQDFMEKLALTRCPLFDKVHK